MACVWQGKGNRLGMLADAQLSWHDSMCAKVFPSSNAEADDSDVI